MFRGIMNGRAGQQKLQRRPARYSALQLLRRGLRHDDWPRSFHHHDLAASYDVVIVGAGVHGLATAHYLAANHGITNVAVLDKGYIGGGGSGRNTAIVRSNYLTPEGVRFYDRSVKLYERLSADLNFNVMFSQRGHLTLAHNDSSLRTMRWRAEVNKLEGIDSEVIGPERIKRLVPFMDVSEQARYPILGALYHPPGGTIRHDAVNWGYARAADHAGVRIHQQTVVVGGTLHVYVSQTDRGELVFGASTDPYPSYGMRGSLEFTEELAGHVLELMPSIAKLRVLRQWAGLCDMTPDFSPIMGITPVEGFLVDVGWGTYGFKAGPAAGESVAELVATGKTPELIAAFDLARFAEGRLVGEKGAAAVGH